MAELYNIDSIISEAATLEKENELGSAAPLYEKVLKQAPADVNAHTRLIIIYRKLKNYKKELDHIRKLIKIEEGYYTPKSKGRAVNILSNKLNISLGRTDKKGKLLFVPDSIKKLQKREEVVKRKLSK